MILGNTTGVSRSSPVSPSELPPHRKPLDPYRHSKHHESCRVRHNSSAHRNVSVPDNRTWRRRNGCTGDVAGVKRPVRRMAITAVVDEDAQDCFEDCVMTPSLHDVCGNGTNRNQCDDDGLDISAVDGGSHRTEVLDDTEGEDEEAEFESYQLEHCSPPSEPRQLKQDASIALETAESNHDFPLDLTVYSQRMSQLVEDLSNAESLAGPATAETAVSQVVREHVIAAVLSALPGLPESSLAPLVELQSQWLPMQERAIRSTCQTLLATDAGTPRASTPHTPLQHTLSRPGRFTTPVAAQPAPHDLHRDVDGWSSVISHLGNGSVVTRATAESGRTSPVPSLGSAASSCFSRRSVISTRVREEVTGHMERAWDRWETLFERYKAISDATSPWGAVVVLEQAQACFHDILTSFTQSTQAAYTIRLRSELDRRRKAERALARARTDIALLSEALETERGHGGEEALLKVADLEQQLRRMDTLNQRLKKDLVISREREHKALQDQADAERRVAQLQGKDGNHRHASHSVNRGDALERKPQRKVIHDAGMKGSLDSLMYTNELQVLTEQLSQAKQEAATWQKRAEALQQQQQQQAAPHAAADADTHKTDHTSNNVGALGQSTPSRSPPKRRAHESPQHLAAADGDDDDVSLFNKTASRHVKIVNELKAGLKESEERAAKLEKQNRKLEKQLQEVLDAAMAAKSAPDGEAEGQRSNGGRHAQAQNRGRQPNATGFVSKISWLWRAHE